jgi:hypothetical protein
VPFNDLTFADHSFAGESFVAPSLSPVTTTSAAPDGSAEPEPNPREVSASLRASSSMSATAEIIKAPPKPTRRRSVADQVVIVRTVAPVALDGVHQLICAVEAKRFNDPKTHEALAALKELHRAIGDLITTAEDRSALAKAWDAIDAQRERVISAIVAGGKVMVAAPVLAIGTAHVLSYLSGFPITDAMVTALCASNVMGEALAKRD